MRQRSYYSFIIIFLAISFLCSCSKDGTDLIDSTTNFPLNWKSNDSIPLVAYSVKDSIRAIRNTSIAPVGVSIEPNFGTFRASFYANYQTTLTSKSFSFTSIDSVVLIIPYYHTTPTYGKANQPFSLEVYEMTEDIVTDAKSTKMTYAYNSTVLGAKTFTPNYIDSIVDNGVKTPPAVRIALSNTLGTKLIAAGTYSSDAQLREIFKGLYVRTSSNTSTNGFIMLSTGTDNILRIYGKNASGSVITSDFSTGGANSTTINEYLHDNTSLAYQSTVNPNTTLGDNLLYSHGLTGYFARIKLPDLSSFIEDKNIFKAELSLYSVDTTYKQSADLGLMIVDSLGKEYPIPDEIYKNNFLISIKDTLISGITCVEYKYNIGFFINRLAIRPTGYSYLNIYSERLSFGTNTVTKFSDYVPSRLVMGGSTHPAKPKLKLYYTLK